MVPISWHSQELMLEGTHTFRARSCLARREVRTLPIGIRFCQNRCTFSSPIFFQTMGASTNREIPLQLLCQMGANATRTMGANNSWALCLQYKQNCGALLKGSAMGARVIIRTVPLPRVPIKTKTLTRPLLPLHDQALPRQTTAQTTPIAMTTPPTLGADIAQRRRRRRKTSATSRRQQLG